MTPWHSCDGTGTGPAGGASSERVFGGSNPRKRAVTFFVSTRRLAASSRVGRQGQTSSAGWEPAGCQISASAVCVVVASSGESLTLACRIGRKSARPSGAANIALFAPTEQMRWRGRRTDLYDCQREGGFASYETDSLATKSGKSPLALYNERCTADRESVGDSCDGSVYVQLRCKRGLRRSSPGGR